MRWPGNPELGLGHGRRQDLTVGDTYGFYIAIGHLDVAAGTFTLTRPAIPFEECDGPPVRPEPEHLAPGTPCSEPAGGWRVLDPAKTTDDSVDLTVTRARHMASYAGLWVDQSHGTKREYNDPTQLILNVAFTRDLEARERELRKSWGGSLCVSQALRTEKELEHIRDEVVGPPKPRCSALGEALMSSRLR